MFTNSYNLLHHSNTSQLSRELSPRVEHPLAVLDRVSRDVVHIYRVRGAVTVVAGAEVSTLKVVLLEKLVESSVPLFALTCTVYVVPSVKTPEGTLIDTSAPEETGNR